MAEHSEKTGLLLSDKTYDMLQRTAEIVLPGLGALYFALAQFWDLPKAEQVVGSLAAIGTFTGVLLRASRKNYVNSDAQYDGAIVEDDSDPENPAYRFQLNDDVDADTVLNKKQLVFKGVSL